jgi:hypothetical protein
MCLKVAAGDYLSTLCLFLCVWLGWLAGTILPRLLRASHLCTKAHTCHFPAQLAYTKARPHSLRTATRPKRLTGIQGLLWRMPVTAAVADTPTDQPTNGLHDRDTTSTRWLTCRACPRGLLSSLDPGKSLRTQDRRQPPAASRSQHVRLGQFGIPPGLK